MRHTGKSILIVVVLLLSLSLWGLLRVVPVTAGITPTPTATPTLTQTPTGTPTVTSTPTQTPTPTGTLTPTGTPTPTGTSTPPLVYTSTPTTEESGAQPSLTPTATSTPIPLLPATGDAVSTVLLALGLGCLLLLVFGGTYLAHRRA